MTSAPPAPLAAPAPLTVGRRDARPARSGGFGVALALVLALLAAFAALSRSSAPGPGEPPPPPAVRFAATTFDFGVVPHGEVARHRFVFKNEGEGRLDVLGIESSCGCVVSAPSRRSLAKGEEAYLEVAFDSASKVPHAKPTRYKNQVLVRTNDRANPEVVLTLEGAVYSRYQLAPRGGAIFPSTPVVGAPLPHEPALVDVYPQDGDLALLRAARVARAPRGVRVEGPLPHTSPEAGHEGVRFRVFLTPELEPGVLRERIEVAIDDPAHPTLAIPVIVTARPSVTPSAGALYLPVERAERRLDLAAARAVERAAPPRVLRAVAIEDRGGEPSVEIEPRRDGLGGEVFYGALIRPRPRADGSAPVGGRGVLRFFVTDPFTPVVEVPYRLVDQGGRNARIERAKATRALVSPPDLELRSYDAGSSELVRLTVSSLGAGLDLQDVKVTGSPYLEVSHEPVQGDRVARILLAVRPAPPGAIDGVIRFRPRPGDPALEVPVSGRILPRLEAAPLGAYLARGVVTARFRVKRRDAAARQAGAPVPLAVRSVKASDDRVQARLVHDGASGEAEVEVEVDVSALPEGPFEVTVSVAADLAGEPPVVVPIFGER